jgi:hypothetical protein
VRTKLVVEAVARQKPALVPPISPIMKGADGFPYGVSTSTCSTSSRNE